MLFSPTEAVENVRMQIKENLLSELENSINTGIGDSDFIFSVFSNVFDFWETKFKISNTLIKPFKSCDDLMGGALLIDKDTNDFILLTEILICKRKQMIAISNNLEVERRVNQFIYETIYNDDPAMDILNSVFYDGGILNISVKAQNILLKYAIFKNHSTTDCELSNRLISFIEDKVENRIRYRNSITAIRSEIIKSILKSSKFSPEISILGSRSLVKISEVCSQEYERILHNR